MNWRPPKTYANLPDMTAAGQQFNADLRANAEDLDYLRERTEMNEQETHRASVIVNVHSSSTRGGQIAAEVTATSDATDEERENAVRQAWAAWHTVQSLLEDELSRKLEESLATLERKAT